MKQVLLNFKVCIKRVDNPKVLPVCLGAISILFFWLSPSQISITNPSKEYVRDPVSKRHLHVSQFK